MSTIDWLDLKGRMTMQEEGHKATQAKQEVMEKDMGVLLSRVEAAEQRQQQSRIDLEGLINSAEARVNGRVEAVQVEVTGTQVVIDAWTSRSSTNAI